jgi:hypothetical protein
VIWVLVDAQAYRGQRLYSLRAAPPLIISNVCVSSGSLVPPSYSGWGASP